MGLLDYLFDQNTYGGQGGLLSRLQPSMEQFPQSQGFPQQEQPASFNDRFGAMPGAPPAFNPSGRSFDTATFDPSTYAPNQAQSIGVGGYQMPRMGSADLYQPQQAMTPPNATPTQGQMPPNMQGAAPNVQGAPPNMQGPSQNMQGAPQQQALPPAFGGGSILGRIGNPDGLIARLTGNDSRSIAQQNLKAQYDSLVPLLGPQKAMLAVMNPEAGKTLLSEALTSKEKYQKTGVDAFGNETYGFVNDRDQTVNGKPVGAEDGAAGQSSGGFLAPGVKQIDSSLSGGDYLKQFSPEIQAAVQNYIDGKSTPTGNPRKGFTQTVKMIAQKVGADTGQSVDDASFAARKTMRNQLSSSAPSSLGGQINIGNTAAGHLADLTQRAIDLNNYDMGLSPLTSAVNNARGLGTEQAAKMEALKGAAQHYGQEITKFYAGSPGGVAERDRFIESVNGARSPKELAAILSTEAELMRSRLDALGGQIKGVLGEEGAKQYPVLRPDGESALKKVEENVSRLKGGQGSQAASGGVHEGATATNPQTGQKLTFRGGKWQ